MLNSPSNFIVLRLNKKIKNDSVALSDERVNYWQMYHKMLTISEI